jgi:hypothetical protein
MSVLDDVKRTAVNQRPHGGTNYPMTGPGDFSGVVLDAYVSYYDPTDAYPLPFALDVAGTTVTVYAADLTVVTQFDTAAAVTRAWGTRTVYEWYADPVVLRLVLASAFVDGRETLDPRTCNRLTRHVRSIRVGLFRMTGNVRFESGYNVPIAGTLPEEPVDGGRYAPQVAMDAVPGGGAGRLDGCDDVAAVVKRINRVGPDCSGNFRVEYDDCFRAQLPLLVTGNQDEERTAEYAADDMTSSEAQHAVKLYSDCHPCCECDYYVRTYRGLKRMWNIWKALAADAETVRDTYDANVLRWNDARECKIANPARLVDERENYELGDAAESDEMMDLFNHMVIAFEKNMNNKALNDNDKKVLDSILVLFKGHGDQKLTSDELEELRKTNGAKYAVSGAQRFDANIDDNRYSKGNILDFIADRSKLSKEDMSKSLTKLRNLYKEKKKDFYNKDKS